MIFRSIIDLNLQFLNNVAIIKTKINLLLAYIGKLDKQGYVVAMLKSSLLTFYRRHYELVDWYEISISEIAMDLFTFCRFFPFLYHPQDFYQTCLYK